MANRRASGNDDVLLFEEHGTNHAITYTARKGDAASVASALRAPRKVQRAATQRRVHGAEGLLAVWDGQRTKLTVSGAAKVPFVTRRALAQRMDLPDECVDMIESTSAAASACAASSIPRIS